MLAAISEDLLLFGPDTGHLAWAGADPADIIERHLHRVGAVHLKDLRTTITQDALEQAAVPRSDRAERVHRARAGRR